MAIVDVTTRTIKCDNPACDKTVTFNPANQEEIAKLPDWLRALRSIHLGNGQQFFYCSDVCEVEGVTTGKHNVPEPPKVQAANEQDMKRAVVEKKLADAMKTQPGEGEAGGDKKVTLT